LKTNKGFTLIELVIVIAIIGVLATISLPFFKGWMLNAEYRGVARDISSTLRLARGSAISTNTEHDVTFNFVANAYSVMPAFPVADVPPTVDLRGKDDCSDNTGTTFNIQFNPNGTRDSSVPDDKTYVCILDNSGVKKYRVGVPSKASGRVLVQKWTGSSWN